MKGSPTPSEETPLAPEAPPSYDYATTFPPDPPSVDAEPSGHAGPSTSTATQNQNATTTTPKNIQHLFSGPPNAEPVYGVLTTSLGVLGGIETTSSQFSSKTWDSKLDDPQVLYDFLRYRAQARPGFRLKCEGAHWVHHDHDHTVVEDGYRVEKRKGQSDRVIDFSFFIDLSDILNHPDNTSNVHLSACAPDLPAHRGTQQYTYSSLFAPPEDKDYYALASDIELGGETTLPGKAVTGRALNLWYKAAEWTAGKGLPTWFNPLVSDDFWETRRQAGPSTRLGGLENTPMGHLVNRSVSLRGDEEDARMTEERREMAGDVERVREQWDQPTLKAWCEAYTNNKALLKEFTMKKRVWGWDLEGLQAAVKGAILSTGYTSNDLAITFELDDNELQVHPNNLLSRIYYRGGFVQFFLWLILVYPLIWLFKRYHSLGGAPYDITRATYGLKYYPPLPSTFPAETLQAAQDRLPALYKLHPEIPQNATLVRGPKGVHYLLGRREGEFFREWEERIRMGVNMRYKGELVGARVGERESLDLDGY